MNCTTCNAELKSGSATCLECGAAVSAAPAVPKDRVFGDWVNLAVRIIKREDAAVEEAARDPNATMFACLFLVIAAAAPSLGSLAIFAFLFMVPGVLIATAIGLGIIHLVATALGGKGEYVQLFRVNGLAQMLGWVNAVPFLGPIVGIFAMLYGIAVNVNNVRVLYKMPLSHAIAVVVLPVLLVLGFVITVAVVFGGVFLAMVSHAH